MMPRARVRALYDTPMSGPDIEARSFAIIDAEAPRGTFSDREWRVVARMIHTSGDLSLGAQVRFSPDALAAATAALRAGRPLYVDARMAAAGLSLERLQRACPSYRPEHVHCHVADPDVAEEARRSGLPRSLFALRKARGVVDGGITVIGNAPVALLELNRLVMEEGVRPALVIGLPVGFVHVLESKQELMALDVPWIVLAGYRGGSPLGVCVVHALCGLAEEAPAARRPALGDGARADASAAAAAPRPSATSRRAVIVMGHGSRLPGAGAAMEQVAAQVKARCGHAILECCYMSMCPPTFEEAFARCVAQGATEVAVIPYFLHSGAHIREDIPGLIAGAARAFPNVRLVFGEPLGYDPCLVDLLHKRIEACSDPSADRRQSRRTDAEEVRLPRPPSKLEVESR